MMTVVIMIIMMFMLMLVLLVAVTRLPVIALAVSALTRGDEVTSERRVAEGAPR